MSEPSNLPDGWEYQQSTNSVVCCGCLFRFGAEHPDSDGKWTCPNCGDGNGNQTPNDDGWRDISTAPENVNIELRGIYSHTNGGTFQATHFRPIQIKETQS
jgi:phage/plasmid primase-like uncharacterized protein